MPWQGDNFVPKKSHCVSLAQKKKPGADSQSQNAVIAQVCGRDMAHEECGWVLKLKDGMVISRKIG